MSLPTFISNSDTIGPPWNQRANELAQLREEAFNHTLNHHRLHEETSQTKLQIIVLCRLSTDERQRRRHEFYGSLGVPYWSLLKRVVKVTANEHQVTVKDLYTGKERIYSDKDVKPFMGEGNLLTLTLQNEEAWDRANKK